MTYDIVIISAGKMGRETYCFAQDVIAAGESWRIKGFLDSRRNALEGFNYDVPILANVEDYTPEENDRFICAIGDPRARKLYCEKILAKGGRFVNLIHPTVVIGRNVKLGTGIIVGPQSTLTADLTVGNFVAIGGQTTCGHDNVIGDWTQICGHCCLTGNVEVGPMCFIGAGATLVPSVKVDEGAFVGAASLVIKRVPPHTKVFGVPAFPIGIID